MKTLAKYEFTRGAVGGSRYPWDEILDGKIHELEESKDYDCKPANFAMQARKQAKKRKGTARINQGKDGKSIIVQFVSGNSKS